MATTNRTFKNASLEARRRQDEQRRRADALLRASRKADRSPANQIELGLSDNPGPGRLANWIFARKPDRAQPRLRAFRDLLRAAAYQRSAMLQEEKYIDAFERLARHYSQWRRAPADWEPRSHNVARQFASLARHLLARDDVPSFFDSVWLTESPELHQEWFIHVGGGQNLRSAPGLPFPLTKMMAHHAMHAPGDCSVEQALRWGQVLGLGGTRRLAQAVIGTRLAKRCPDEPFWLTAVQFFVNNPLLEMEQVGPIVDYLHHQRFEPQPARVVNGIVQQATATPLQPNLSMKRRTVQSLLRQVREWHRDLGRSRRERNLAWGTCGIAGFERIEGEIGNQRLWTITELLSGCELREEGRAMHHCVGSYAHSCQSGRYAIYSMKLDIGAGAERRLTITVVPSQRQIVEARGKCNRMPEPLDVRILRAWAATARLTIAPYALAR